jgi:predicted hotdog family 3-hydroxylacyl-ACP dehydratase
MDNQRTREIIREVARLGFILPSRHCRQKMLMRNVDMQDILQALMWGQVSDIREDENHQNWKCTVTGADCDGDSLVVQVAISDERSIFLITVY